MLTNATHQHAAQAASLLGLRWGFGCRRTLRGRLGSCDLALLCFGSSQVRCAVSWLSCVMGLPHQPAEWPQHTWLLWGHHDSTLLRRGLELCAAPANHFSKVAERCAESSRHMLAVVGDLFDLLGCLFGLCDVLPSASACTLWETQPMHAHDLAVRRCLMVSAVKHVCRHVVSPACCALTVGPASRITRGASCCNGAGVCLQAQLGPRLLKSKLQHPPLSRNAGACDCTPPAVYF